MSTRAWVRSCDYYVNISHFYPPTLPFISLSPSFPLALLPPCLSPGTAAAGMWTIHFKGRLFHSGLPHKGINSIELASEAMAYIQRRFYEDFPPVSVCVCTRLLHPPILPCGYITCVLVCACVYVCVYDCMCLFGGIRSYMVKLNVI